MTKSKGEIDNYIIIVGNFNIPIILDRSNQTEGK